MFERLQKPFLTVETGEAYQPIRLTYDILKEEALLSTLNKLGCCQSISSNAVWEWYWEAECESLNFKSVDSFVKRKRVLLGTFTLKPPHLYLSLHSFKRACLAVPFFHKIIDPQVALVHKADFLNKVFGLEEHLPHGFAELFPEEELDRIVNRRIHEYEAMQARVEEADTAEEALAILSKYTETEGKKPLPYSERYVFNHAAQTDPDILFLGFYIFLRGRELVAIRRWFGESGYTLANAADDTIEKVFGNVDIDIIE